MNKNNAKNWRYIIGFHVILCSTYSSFGEVHFNVDFSEYLQNNVFNILHFSFLFTFATLGSTEIFWLMAPLFCLLTLIQRSQIYALILESMFLSLFLNCECDIDKTFFLILLYQYLILSFFIVLSSLFIFCNSQRFFWSLTKLTISSFL